MGLIRKALYIATFGLSGLVFKETPSPERTEKPAPKQMRSRTQAKATPAKSQAARKRKAQATRASTAPQAARSGNGTIRELERLADLHRRGGLSDDEFAAAKSKLLGTSLAPKPPETAPATFPAVEANITAARHLGELGANDRSTSFAPISRD
jgi:putative oligomerization/nucleic acid binding protein